MKTQNLVQKLSMELKPGRRIESLSHYLLKCAFVAGILLGISFLILPHRADLPQKLSEVHFWIETALYFTFTLFSLIVVYKSSLPGVPVSNWIRTTQLLLFGLAFGVMSRWTFVQLRSEWTQSLELSCATCGLLIFLLGLLSAGILLSWVRKAAPVHLALTSVWMAMAGGALGILTMQFVCPFENPIHVFVWHFAPVGLLCFVGIALSQKLLRW